MKEPYRAATLRSLLTESLPIAAASITRARKETRVLMEHGLIGATVSAQGL